jgi:hypothetical protein
MSRSRISAPYHPENHEFRISTNACPGVNVAIAKLTFLLGGHIFFFGIAESPNFITLNPFTGKLSQVFILIFKAGFSHFTQELNDSVFDHITDTCGRSNAVAFHEAF